MTDPMKGVKHRGGPKGSNNKPASAVASATSARPDEQQRHQELHVLENFEDIARTPRKAAVAATAALATTPMKSNSPRAASVAPSAKSLTALASPPVVSSAMSSAANSVVNSGNNSRLKKGGTSRDDSRDSNVGSSSGVAGARSTLSPSNSKLKSRKGGKEDASLAAAAEEDAAMASTGEGAEDTEEEVKAHVAEQKGSKRPRSRSKSPAEEKKPGVGLTVKSKGNSKSRSMSKQDRKVMNASASSDDEEQSNSTDDEGEEDADDKGQEEGVEEDEEDGGEEEEEDAPHVSKKSRKRSSQVDSPMATTPRKVGSRPRSKREGTVSTPQAKMMAATGARSGGVGVLSASSRKNAGGKKGHVTVATDATARIGMSSYPKRKRWVLCPEYFSESPMTAVPTHGSCYRWNYSLPGLYRPIVILQRVETEKGKVLTDRACSSPHAEPHILRARRTILMRSWIFVQRRTSRGPSQIIQDYSAHLLGLKLDSC